MKDIIAKIKRPLKPLKGPLYGIERSIYYTTKKQLKLPDFLGIGSGQAGSTWMYKNMNYHPDIFLPSTKEIHYFSRRFNDWSLRHYSSLFREAGERICGEFTPAYNMLLPKRIKYIRKIMPDVRLLLIIRNPVDRAWSAARRVMSRIAKQEGIFFEDIDDDEFFEYFEKEWAYRPERNQGGDFIPGMLQGNYCKAIDNWTSYFPREQLLVCFFDEIKRDPQRLLCRVFKHIGVSTDIDWQSMPISKVINKNPDHNIPERFIKYLRNKYNNEIRELSKRYPNEVKEWVV